MSPTEVSEWVSLVVRGEQAGHELCNLTHLHLSPGSASGLYEWPDSST